MSHLEKVKLIKGDIIKTSKKYIKENPAQTVRILHIGMNFYKPTLYTLKNFIPRMSKGSIVAIDGLNYATGGCMTALREVIKLEKLRIKILIFILILLTLKFNLMKAFKVCCPICQGKSQKCIGT